MSTRSIIATPRGDGWQGRYFHSDGYPTWNGRVLWELVQRDGLETVTDTLLMKHGGWSTLDNREGHDQLTDYNSDGRFVGVPGYGIAYTSEPHPLYDMKHGQCSLDDWIKSSDKGWVGTEWLYVLSPGGLVVAKVGYRTKGGEYAIPCGIFPWNGVEPDWAKVECGENYETCCHMAFAHIDDLPEDAQRLSMREWLGLEPVRTPSHVLFEGVRLKITGSGSRRDATVISPAVWIGDVEFPDGTVGSIPLYHYSKTGNYKGMPGRKYEYPATSVAPAHVRTTPAGGLKQIPETS